LKSRAKPRVEAEIAEDLLCWWTSLHPRTLLREIAAGSFPTAHRLGYWDLAEVWGWFQTRERAEKVEEGSNMIQEITSKWLRARIVEPEFRFMRRDEVLGSTGLSLSSLKRFIRLGQFPRPFKISERCVAWRSDEVKTAQNQIIKMYNEGGELNDSGI
jgi:predicted DNA-binding transcriptional regulator AlpA